MNGQGLVITVVITSTILFNLILLTTWCMIKRRRAQMKRRLIENAYIANPMLSRWNTKSPALWESNSSTGIALLPFSPVKGGSPLKGTITLSTAGLTDRLQAPRDYQRHHPFTGRDRISDTESPVTSVQHTSPVKLPAAMDTTFPRTASSTSTRESPSHSLANDTMTQSVTSDTRNRSQFSVSASTFGQNGRAGFLSPFPQIREALAPETYTKAHWRVELDAEAASSNRLERPHYRTISESVLRTPAPPYPKHTRAPVSPGSQRIGLRDSVPLSAIGHDRPRETSLHHSVSLPLSPTRAASSFSPRRRGFAAPPAGNSIRMPSSPVSPRSGATSRSSPTFPELGYRF